MTQLSSLQSLSYATLCNPMDCSKPGFPSQSQLLKLAQIYVHWVGDVIQPSHPLSSPSPPAFNLSQHQGLFQLVSFLYQVAKVLEFVSASVLPMNIQDWFPLGQTGWISLQSKGLSRVLQHHSSKASVLQCSGFFIVQLSYPYMTTGKTMASTRWTFVGKVMSLFFKTQLKLSL